MKTVEELRIIIENTKARPAWGRGVVLYAFDLLIDMDDLTVFNGYCPLDKKVLLNGADNWTQYSEGGCALAYDGDIAERLCTPSELKRNRHGELYPNGHESWLEAQARALGQAAHLIMRIAQGRFNTSL